MGLYDPVDYITSAISSAAGRAMVNFFGFHTLFIAMFIFSLGGVLVSVIYYLNRT